MLKGTSEETKFIFESFACMMQNTEKVCFAHPPKFDTQQIKIFGKLLCVMLQQTLLIKYHLLLTA